MLGDMFKWLSISCETFTYPTGHTQWHHFCQTSYILNPAPSPHVHCHGPDPSHHISDLNYLHALLSSFCCPTPQLSVFYALFRLTALKSNFIMFSLPSMLCNASYLTQSKSPCSYNSPAGLLVSPWSLECSTRMPLLPLQWARHMPTAEISPSAACSAWTAFMEKLLAYSHFPGVLAQICPYRPGRAARLVGASPDTPRLWV